MLHHELVRAFHVSCLRQIVFLDERRGVFVWAVMDYGNFVEISVRRRAFGFPFEGCGFPGISGSLRAPNPGADEIDREKNLAEAEAEGAHADEEVHAM